MKQAVHILNKFSDEFVAAILERHDTNGVLEHYISSHPEMEQDLRENAQYLSEVYGYLQNATFPSQQEADNAYARVKAKIGENPASVNKQVSSMSATPRWSAASMLSWLPIKKHTDDFGTRRSGRSARRPAFGLYLSGAMGVALALIALLFWSPSKNSQQSAQNGGSDQPAPSVSTPNSGTGEYATSGEPKPTDSRTPFNTPSELRGEKQEQVSKAQQHRDSLQVNKLSQKSLLTSPSAVTAKVNASGVDLSWSVADGALSYIIEIKPEGSASWQQVKMVPITRAKLTGLSAGKYSVRITATAGEQKAAPGKASTFTVE